MKKCIFIMISIIIIFFSSLFFILPKEKFSENENRYLQNIPEFSFNNLVDGRYTKEIDNFITDHFPFREELFGFKTNLLKLFSKKQNGVYYAEDGYLIEEYKTGKNSEKIVNITNDFANKFPNKKISFMLVPTSSLVYRDKLPKYNLIDDEMISFNYYKNNLNTNFIDISDILLKNNNKYLYYKTDHHWTMNGCYYAYLEYCKIFNIQANNYKLENVSNSFYGTLYSKVLDNNLDSDYIYKIIDNTNYTYSFDNKYYDSVYFDKYLKEKDKYLYYLGGNHGISKITNNDLISGNNLLIIKDSYANSFIPLLIPHYKNIYIIDPRYYNDSISEFIDNNDYINEILFLYNIQTIDDDLGILTINS